MIGEVRSAVAVLKDAARGVEPRCLDGRDAAALLEDVAEATRACAALETSLARRVDETGVWREGGHRSAAHYLAATTGETIGVASRALDTARRLETLPETAEAFRSGDLSAVHRWTDADGAYCGSFRLAPHPGGAPRTVRSPAANPGAAMSSG